MDSAVLKAGVREASQHKRFLISRRIIIHQFLSFVFFTPPPKLCTCAPNGVRSIIQANGKKQTEITINNKKTHF